MNDTMNNTALLLIDLQRDFLETSGQMPISARNADIVIRCASASLTYR